MRLINEDDVLEIIEHVTNEAVEKNQRKYLIQPRIIAEIAGLPTIEAEPVKHGRWIEKEAYEEDRQMGFNFQIVCSNCDEQNSVLYSFDENSEPTEKYFMRTPWCPWCGARMDGDSK